MCKIHINIQMKLFPNAKINIGLNIVEKRTDGYHNIETVFYPIPLQDILIINKEANTEPVDNFSGYKYSDSGIIASENPEQNLVVKAFRLLQKNYNIQGVSIELNKRIPFGAGLGGGSSDAAFTLKALNELFQLNLSFEQLEMYAGKLGADCPVFIQNKPVFATGIGNIFTPLNLSLSGYYLVLVKPEIHVSTPVAYAKIKAKNPQHALIDSIAEPIENWKSLIQNDFEQPVFEQYPLLRNIKQQMYERGAIYASMSGSGSSVYGIFKTKPVDLKEFENYFTFIDRF